MTMSLSVTETAWDVEQQHLNRTWRKKMSGIAIVNDIILISNYDWQQQHTQVLFESLIHFIV